MEGVNGPTLIMGRMMVSWGLLKDVLCDLVCVGLIECRTNNARSGRRSYYITSKGEEFLHVFENKEIRDLLKSVNVAAS
jgi:predicted transcriptional regulator